MNNQIGIRADESNRLTIIRAAAMLMVVFCHYVNWFEPIAVFSNVFNVGALLFFVLSGFLYGQKEIANSRKWLKRQFFKITAALYVYYGISAVILCSLGKLGKVNPYHVLFQLLNLRGFVNCGIGEMITGHLWFTSFILVCYLITPLLQKIRAKISAAQILLLIVLLSAADIGFVMAVKPFAFIMWLPGIITYIAAYFIGAFWQKRMRLSQYLMLTISMVAVTGLKILAKLMSGRGSVLAEMIYSRFLSEDAHCILAVWIFFTLYLGLGLFRHLAERVYPTAKLLSKYSYEVYITHYLFLIGPLSLEKAMGNMLLNSLLFVTLTAVYAVFLHGISNWILKRIP